MPNYGARGSQHPGADVVRVAGDPPSRVATVAGRESRLVAAAARGAASVQSVSVGGTGVASLPSGGLVVGAGASPVTALLPGAAGQVVRSNGTVWQSAQVVQADLGGGQNANAYDTAVSYKVGGTKVVGAQEAGWTTCTGTKTKGGIDSGTATLQQVAQVVGALVDLMHNHGLTN